MSTVTGAVIGVVSVPLSLAGGPREIALSIAAVFGGVLGFVLHPLLVWSAWRNSTWAAWVLIAFPSAASAVVLSIIDVSLLGVVAVIAVYVISCVFARLFLPIRAEPGRCTSCRHVLLSEVARCPECGVVPVPSPPAGNRHNFDRRLLATIVGVAAAIAMAFTLVFAIGVISVLLDVNPTFASRSELRALLASDSMTVQHHAVTELARRGGEELGALLDDGDGRVRRNAYRAARFSNLPDRCELLFAGLFDPDRFVRYEAMLGVEECAVAGDEPRVREAIAQETDPGVRSRLQAVLARLNMNNRP